WLLYEERKHTRVFPEIYKDGPRIMAQPLISLFLMILNYSDSLYLLAMHWVPNTSSEIENPIEIITSSLERVQSKLGDRKPNRNNNFLTRKSAIQILITHIVVLSARTALEILATWLIGADGHNPPRFTDQNYFEYFSWFSIVIFYFEYFSWFSILIFYFEYFSWFSIVIFYFFFIYDH
ncbi:hypothetical protein ACJX0J_006811, partial [Zea mays]